MQHSFWSFLVIRPKDRSWPTTTDYPGRYDDMFLANALLPIGLVIILFKAFKWVASATK